MTKESRQSSEKLRGIANITNALVVQIEELLKLREAVQEAEETSARKTAMQRHHEIPIAIVPSEDDWEVVTPQRYRKAEPELAKRIAQIQAELRAVYRS